MPRKMCDDSQKQEKSHPQRETSGNEDRDSVLRGFSICFLFVFLYMLTPSFTKVLQNQADETENDILL